MSENVKNSAERMREAPFVITFRNAVRPECTARLYLVTFPVLANEGTRRGWFSRAFRRESKDTRSSYYKYYDAFVWREEWPFRRYQTCRGTRRRNACYGGSNIGENSALWRAQLPKILVNP